MTGVHLELLGTPALQHPYVPFDFSPFPVVEAFRQRLGIFPANNSHPRTESYMTAVLVGSTDYPSPYFQGIILFKGICLPEM